MLASAELTLSVRVSGMTQADVRAELWERRTLLKTWTMRGTLRRLSAAERSVLAEEAERIGAFLGVEPELRVGRLSA